MKKTTAQRLRKSIMLLCKFTLTCLITGIFYLAYRLFYEDATFFRRGNVIMLFLYMFLYFVFMRIYGGYDIGKLRIHEVQYSNMIATFMVNFIMFFVMSLVARNMLNPFVLIITMLIQWGTSLLAYLSIYSIHRSLYKPIPTIMIFSKTEYDIKVAAKFKKSTTYYELTELCPEEMGFEAIANEIAPYSAVITGNIDIALRDKLIPYCFQHGKQLFLLPTEQDIILNNAKHYTICDTFVYSCKNRSFSLEQLIIKRLIDISASFFGLVVAFPIMLATAIAIKFDDKGPVFYKQKRLTRNAHEFTILKFRSMVVDADKPGESTIALQDDKRITRVGKFIRSARIDELPQLINVLVGDMSLVGPRPDLAENYEHFCKEYPQFIYRLKVKAGLTGLAQLYGKYNTSAVDKAKLDLLYIEKASIMQDLRLLLYTFKVIFIKESTQGAGQKAASEFVHIDTNENI
ncbi:MAG: exopolysaccharide biosynthesis polyprenyl glycosylphosphotransferase [Clostridiales bacterium]|nr:exopolysaccharide biosynthesis polyprenyl glycosylphosphotransferase [Clostridiales bacterium]